MKNLLRKSDTYIANRNWSSAGKIYSMHTMPVLLDCNFVVDSTNGNGLGIRSLKGPAIANVFMHTSASPGIGNNGVLNPNPEAGVIMVQLADNYNRYLSGFAGFIAPLGSSSSTQVAGNPYVITALGSMTNAQWVAAGVPSGVTPAVGLGYIAKSSSALTGSATAAAPSASGIDHIETIGDPNQAISSVPQGQGYLLSQCFLAASPATPANGTVISLAFYLNNSSVLVQGE